MEQELQKDRKSRRHIGPWQCISGPFSFVTNSLQAFNSSARRGSLTQVIRLQLLECPALPEPSSGLFGAVQAYLGCGEVLLFSASGRIRPTNPSYLS